ncbi:thiamine-phosphate kinase [Candidatus Kirkpatrickella diaphorinae]|uniref:Thiamine-monophosphate kinase n=1 Tax=Candidatus Kirkpatrickella diaphorinae TaxID=2984322 RepID=A0ABY6GJW7_9PROT|nr:thiamine-phosphate kinase [Candidatus Kirkpatrickella diaphorinae]UYH51821.1 thiamine-phosphate kinase [Candidatus Kirkpatrickella diaphorinae]
MMTEEDDHPGGEFDLIARYFTPLAGSGAFQLADDAACLNAVSDGKRQVISTDTIVENVHFLPDDPPDLIARKALRVNISDSAAMGARPVSYLLNLTLPPQRGKNFLAGFSEGLAADQKVYDLALIGGDTTRTDGPLVISVTMIGEVPEAHLLKRGGARPGDAIWVTGSIGNAWLGLQALTGKIDQLDDGFAARYRCPEPRPHVIPPGVATSCLDISDGLIQDAGHIAMQSQVVMALNAADIPLPEKLPPALQQKYFEALVTGGDDYELLFTAPETATATIFEASQRAAVRITRIGTVKPGPAATQLLDETGAPYQLTRRGWQHF